MVVLPFRPVPFRLPLSAVAALAEATARAADARRTLRRQSRFLARLAFGFRLDPDRRRGLIAPRIFRVSA